MLLVDPDIQLQDCSFSLRSVWFPICLEKLLTSAAILHSIDTENLWNAVTIRYLFSLIFLKQTAVQHAAPKSVNKCTTKQTILRNKLFCGTEQLTSELWGSCFAAPQHVTMFKVDVYSLALCLSLQNSPESGTVWGRADSSLSGNLQPLLKLGKIILCSCGDVSNDPTDHFKLSRYLILPPVAIEHWTSSAILHFDPVRCSLVEIWITTHVRINTYSSCLITVLLCCVCKWLFILHAFSRFWHHFLYLASVSFTVNVNIDLTVAWPPYIGCQNTFLHVEKGISEENDPENRRIIDRWLSERKSHHPIAIKTALIEN